jgi:hypothetical protein
VNQYRKLIEPEEPVLAKTLIYSWLVRSSDKTTWGLWWASEVGDDPVGLSCNLWELMLPPNGCCQNKVELEDISWCLLLNDCFLCVWGQVGSQPRQIVFETLSQKYTIKKKGLAEVFCVVKL